MLSATTAEERTLDSAGSVNDTADGSTSITFPREALRLGAGKNSGSPVSRPDGVDQQAEEPGHEGGEPDRDQEGRPNRPVAADGHDRCDGHRRHHDGRDIDARQRPTGPSFGTIGPGSLPGKLRPRLLELAREDDDECLP